jgi:hypothetical protein
MKTLTVDDYGRVRLPDVKPRTKFAYSNDGNGTVQLRELVEAQAPRARLVRRNGRTYLESDKVITNEDVRKALEDFP